MSSLLIALRIIIYIGGPGGGSKFPTPCMKPPCFGEFSQNGSHNCECTNIIALLGEVGILEGATIVKSYTCIIKTAEMCMRLQNN